jgi:hypothetical protein
MTVFWSIQFFCKPKDYGLAVFLKKLLAFGYRWEIGWAAGALTVIVAAEHAFQAHPLRNDDIPGINPFIIGIAMLIN